jgi:peptidoglycan/xylan/chitin deacetylase (PgdA/CDA1 family)
LLALVIMMCRAASVDGTAQVSKEHEQAVKNLVAANPKLVEYRYRLPAEIKARQEYEREHGITFPRLVRGNPMRKEIALTFDDGPHPLFTPKLLDLLRREQVPVTFFVVGKMVDKNPELVQQEAAEGHEVANHTYHHLRLASLPPDMIEPELREGARAIMRALGVPTRLYRPPGGEYDNDVIEVTRHLGYVMVLWTDDPGDYVRPGSAVIEQRAMRSIRNGGILLMHDGIQQTLDILPDLIAKLKKRGFKFVTCSQMARESGDITTGGPSVPIKP